MNRAEVLKELLRLKKRIFWYWIAFNIILFFYYNSTPELYSSSASFYVEQSQKISIAEDIENESTEYVKNGILHRIKSTEMIDFLIRHFDLYTRFGIKNDSAIYYPKIHETVKGMITVTGFPSGEVLVNIKSGDNFLAADMANEIFIKLDTSIKNEFVKSFEKKLMIYRKIADEATKKTEEQNVRLELLINEFKTIVKGTESLKANQTLWDINSKLAGFLREIDTDKSKLEESLGHLEIASNILKDKGLINIKLINKALVDTSSPLVKTIWKFSALSVMSLFCICALIIIIKFKLIIF